MNNKKTNKMNLKKKLKMRRILEEIDDYEYEDEVDYPYIH